jgi:hypothetical protein
MDPNTATVGAPTVDLSGCRPNAARDVLVLRGASHIYSLARVLVRTNGTRTSRPNAARFVVARTRQSAWSIIPQSSRCGARINGMRVDAATGRAVMPDKWEPCKGCGRDVAPWEDCPCIAESGGDDEN